MRFMLRLLILLGLLFQLLSSFVFADSKYPIITHNLQKTNEYIALLQTGVNPDSITRPDLQLINKWKAKRARKEMNYAMDKAEKLARSGRSNQIQLYYYPYQENYNYPDQDTTKDKPGGSR